MTALRPIVLLLSILSLLSGCESGAPQPSVVIYCAHDEIFAAEVLADFEKTTGIKVRAKYDTEAAKTIGLVNTIIAEADAPRCDVFWNNELSQTINLARRGLLASYDSPARQDLPEFARNPNWTAFAARARLIIVNTKRLPDPTKRPRSFDDLIKPEFKGVVGIARPYFGTTATHAAAIFQARGESAAEAWFEALQKKRPRPLRRQRQPQGPGRRRRAGLRSDRHR
jgi:iron(III) transport system substrate-binding protein